MKNLSFFDTLYDYNDWANEQVLDAASRLSPEAYERDFGQAWGSVRGTLTHVFESDHVWLRRWQGDDAQLPRDVRAFPSLAALHSAWTDVMEARRVFLAELAPEELEQPVPYTNSTGAAYAEPLWQLLFHVVNHSTDHRGYLSVMLTELGEPPPPLDFVAWVRGYNWKPDDMQPG